MKNRILVTTALEDTWPNQGESALFLGEWCRLHARKEIWEKIDAVVAEYHWNDRAKLSADYIDLQKLYEELLIKLASKLNAVHGVNFSARYWRILIGPWLGFFIQIVFDRWIMLRKVIERSDIKTVRIIEHGALDLIPNDMTEFESLIVLDEWNELIYGQILNWIKYPVKYIKKKEFPSNPTKIFQKVSLYRQTRRKFFSAVMGIAKIFSRENECFFKSTYLGMWQDFHLQLKLGQIPKTWEYINTPKANIDFNMRLWALPINDASEFSDLVTALIYKHIPICYLEGYQNLSVFTNKLSWPKNPRAIFTSNSHFSDDVFKAWAASKVEVGIPLIIGQHGGNDGVAKWSFVEEHQIAICDYFLSWGWDKPNHKSVIPIGNLKCFGKNISSDNSGYALLVEMILPRYSYHMYSAPVSAVQWVSYFEDQCRFVGALQDSMHDQILIRISAQDYQYSQLDRWGERFPEIRVDNGRHSIESLMADARIYISTYNATTFLESMALNFPTIIFWNPKHWELREEAIAYFEMLKNVGIFHESPEQAALQMTKVWDDVSSWWKSSEVQQARRLFCDKYSRIPNQPIDLMADLISDIINS